MRHFLGYVAIVWVLFVIALGFPDWWEGMIRALIGFVIAFWAGWKWKAFDEDFDQWFSKLGRAKANRGRTTEVSPGDDCDPRGM